MTISTERVRQYATDEFMFAADDVRAMARELLSVREARGVTGTQFKPVADLYEMQFDDGHTCAFHTDAEKAIQWLNTCDGNKVQEYVKLERLQGAFTAPPAPAVPDAVDYSDLDATSRDREVIEAIAECKGWNACRAEMLQPVRQGCKMPKTRSRDGSTIDCSSEQLPAAPTTTKAG